MTRLPAPPLEPPPPATFNARLAVKITRGVGTMWCAYAFAALALASLPSAIGSGSPVTIVSWVSQTFLQLVLLSVTIVGQNALVGDATRRTDTTYQELHAILREVRRLASAVDEQGLQARLADAVPEPEQASAEATSA